MEVVKDLGVLEEQIVCRISSHGTPPSSEQLGKIRHDQACLNT